MGICSFSAAQGRWRHGLQRGHRRRLALQNRGYQTGLVFPSNARCPETIS